jgi:prepilin-type N-terminal cleavage/methylation domain-containing protein
MAFVRDEGNAQTGFTVIELMVVVAIVAVLAIIVIPNFMKDSTRGKAKSEVAAVFAELGNREDQFKQESNTGAYMSAAACPAAASSDGTNVVTTPCTDWTTLSVEPPQSSLTCSYTVRAGVRADSPLSDAGWPSWVSGVTAPATSWYFIKAVCPATEYFVASWDTKLRSKDGK